MRWLSLFLFIGLANAQTFQITEISPHTLGDQAEWFEFYIDSELDLSQYQISNGKNLPKPLSEALAGEDEGYYYFEKSPVSLANDGGVIQILDMEENVLHKATYPKTKSGTKDGEKWVEIWNWSEDYQQFLPLINHFSPGKKNQNLPTPADHFTLLFSESSPDRDFLEFYLQKGPERTNLKYTQIKHNGTVVRSFDHDFIMTPGEFLLLESPISGGSGTVEVLTYVRTSAAAVEDVVCWQKKQLSKTEQSRVDRFIAAKDWSGPCYEVAARIQNESIVRKNSWVDTNTISDLEPHYNGTPGEENLVKNQPPQAVISIQGSGKKIGRPPFSLNLTGEESTDPDGRKDLKAFVWKLDGEVFSEDPNPKNIKLEAIKTYGVSLTVTDYSGASSTVSETIFVTAGASAPSAKSSAEFIAHLEVTTRGYEKIINKDEKYGDFFGPVLKNEVFMNQVFIKSKETHKPKKLAVLPLQTKVFARKITLPLTVRQRLKRNLGLIWDWREAPWAEGVGSISDGAIDQSSERFAVGFGVP